MSDFRMDAFSAQGNYSGVFGTNISKEDSQTDSGSFGFYNVTSPSDSRSDGFTVEKGTTILAGSIGNWTNGEVANVSMTVVSPSGVQLDTATSPAASGQAVILPTQDAPDGSVLSFIIVNPEPGMWSVTVNAAEDAGNFQVAVTTIATNGASEMTQVFESMMQQKQTSFAQMPEGLTSGATASLSGSCIACRCVTYPLALIVAGVVAGSLTLLTGTSAIVEAVISWVTLGTGTVISAAAAIALITGLATAGVLTVDFILMSLCEWAGAC